MLAALHLVYTSHDHPLAGLTALLSWAIILGGVYGFLHLIWDLFRLIAWIGRQDPEPGDSGQNEP